MDNNNIYLDFLRQLSENGSAVDKNEQNKDTEQQTEQQTNTNNQADAPAVTEVREDMDKAFDNTNAFEQYVQELQNRTKYNDASNEKLLGVVSDVAKGNKPYYHLSMQGQQDAYEAQKELNKRLASGDIAYDVQPKKEVAKNKSGYYIYDPENEHNEFLNLSDQQLSSKMKDVKAKLDAMSGTEDDYADTFKIAEKLNEAITYRNEGHKSNDPALRAAIEKENKRRQEQQKAQQQKAIESTDSYKLNLWVKNNLSEEDKYDTIYSSTGYNLGAQAVHGKTQQEAIQIAYAYTQDNSHSLADKKNFVRGALNGYKQDDNQVIPRYLGENMLRANIKNATTEEEKSDSTKTYDEYVNIVKAESPGKSNSYIDKAENEALAKFIASYKKASAENAKLAEDNYDNSFGFLRDEDDIETANLKRASQYLTGVDIAGLIRQAWDSIDTNTMKAYAVRLAESRGEMTEQGIQKAKNEIVDTFFNDCVKYVKEDIPEGAFGVIQNAFANSIAGNLWQGTIRQASGNKNELTLLDVYQQRLQESDRNYNKNGWSGAAKLITSKAFQMGFDTPFFAGIGGVASTATKPLVKPFVSLAVGKWVPKAVYNSAFNAFASTGGGRLVVGVTSGAMTGALFNPISMLSQSYATGQSASFGEYLSGSATGALHFGAMGFTPIIGNYITKHINKVFSGTGKAQTIARTMSNVVVQDVISPGLNAAIVTGLENWREIVKHGISPDLVSEYARTYGEFIGMHLGGKVSHIGKGGLINNLKAMYGYKTALQQQGFTKSELEAINNSEAVTKIKRIINESATIGDAEMKQISELHKDIIADNTIPEGAKLKLFAIVGDSAIATPTITNVERVEEGGKHVVKVYTAEGKLFSANEFSSKSQADNEVKRISNITEKNKILATQSTFDAVWFQQVTNDATRALAETKGVDVTEMSKQIGDIAERSNSGAEISSEDKALLKEFDDAIKTAVNNTTLQNSEQLKNSYKNVGVSIDDILAKDYSQWTKSDKELVSRYVDTMNSAIAKDNERKDAMIRRREVASIIKQSFDEGNSLEDAQSINDTALRVNALENSLGDYLTDELRSEIMNDPVSAYERVYNDENLSAPVKERILEYITTRAKFDGFVSSVNERIDTEIEASNTAIDAITHKSEGNVIEVEVTDNAGIEKGEKVYVINGKLSTYGDSMVDYDKSDKTIAIIVEGDEKPRMISPSKIVRVVNNNSADELKNSAREEIVARISAESNNAVNGTINSVSVGDKISIANDEGNVVEAEVVQPTDKEGNPIAPKEGEVFIKVGEDIFSISLEQLSIRAGNAKYNAISNEYRIEAEPTREDGIRVDAPKAETAENVAPQADKAPDADNIPQQEYKPGQFTLREGGEDKLAIVTGNVDEQGRIQYLVQGENEFRYATNDDMRELAKDYKPYDEEGNTMPEAEAKEVANVEQREAENESEVLEQKVADEFPVDANGKKDYVSAGAERTAKHIYDELELEKENADELVDNNIASATEELAKAEKAKEEALKGVTDPDEMAALQKSANEAVNKAKQKKELWEAVKAERAKQNEEEQSKPTESTEGDAELQITDSDKPRPKQELDENSRNEMQTIARSLGVELVFDESLKENGRYTTIDKETGKPTIHVAMNASNPLESVFGHEATHRVKSLDNESYGELHDVARLMIGDEEFFDRANRKKALYAKNGITLSDADAREEVVSDYIGSLIYDKEHMGKVADKLSKPILSKIRDVVSDFLDYFRRNKMTADERLAKGSLRAIDRAFARASGVHSMMGASALESEGDKKYNLRTEDELAELIRNETTKNRNDKKYKGIVFTEQEVESIINETQELFKAIESALDGNNFWDEWKHKNPEIVFDWRDGQMHPIVTWARNNVEYKYDVSADLLCVNNESIEAILASPDMVKLMGIINDNQVGKGDKYQKGFNSDDYMRLYETLRDMGLNVPCKGCFDAASRLKMLASVSQKFVDLVNETIDRRNKNPEKFDAELRKKAEGESASKITEVGFLGSGESKKAAIEIGVAGDNLTEHITWEQLMSAEGQTKALKEWGGVFRAWQKTGAGRPKDKLLPEPYTGVMTNQTYTIIAPFGKSTPSFREQEVNTGTGLRRNSHSEYRPILIVDEIQFMRDCYLKNLLVFKYMKDLDDARLFGKFGVKMNMSFFPAWMKGAPACGLDKNGNYLPSEESVGSREFVYTDKDGKQHFDGQKGFEEALKLCNEDVSLSSVVMSIPHLLKCMTDVPTHKDPKGIWGSLIPFHASGATAAQLFKQGLGMARAMKHFEEALTDYDKGVTNFEAVQNDRFGKGWKILEGKKKGTNVQEGHKLEFVNGTHYYNKELGLHLFSSWFVKDSELTQEQKDGLFLKTKMTDEERKQFKANLKKTVGTPFSIDYNNTVREIGGKHPYKTAADKLSDELRNMNLIPRFEFEVPEYIFLKMCADAKVDPKHPKLGWKGKGHGWSPTDSDAYYSLWCDYGMTDPKTGKYSPHRPVGFINEKGEREFRLPDNVVEIAKDSVDRYTALRQKETDMYEEIMREYVTRSVAEKKLTQKQADEFLSNLEGPGSKYSLREDSAHKLDYTDGTKYSIVEDKAEIDRLNKEEVEIGYQNIELKDDLSVGSPMASKLRNKGKGRVATSDSQFGKWGVSEENPDMVNENGKIDLVRPDGGSVSQVDYNPYFHIRPYLFNKQFDKAWERPRLVFIETQFPKSELSSGFKADKAKLSVGRHDWNGGELILSRWTKPKAIVPWREVASHWIEEFKDSGVNFNKVPPALINTLRDNGVKILPPVKSMGKNCFEAYEEFKKGNYNPEFITDEQIDAFNEKINSDNTQGEKFSIRANDELEKKSLVGIHNLTDDNLRYAIKLGGLANPSTAVVDTDIMGLEGFGDISMIMPKSLVDKRTGKNVGTYAGDAYTPRFPKGDIVKHISSKGVEKINQDYQGNDQFSRDFREALRSYGSEYGGIAPTLYYLYKLENGGADVVKHEGPKIKSEAHRIMIDKYGEKEWSELSDADKQELVEYRREEIMESLKDVEKSKAEKLVDKLINSSDFDTLAYKKFRSLKMDYNEQKNAGDIDYQGTYNKAQNDVAMSGEQDKFAKWLDEKSIKYEIEDRIFRGYTPSGNRKYAPLTLANISKVMKESGRAGSEAMMSGSPHSLRGKMLPLYKTLESIKKNKGILSDKETYERIRGEIENEYNELISIIRDIKGVDYNDAYYVLEDALLKGFNYAEREAGITIDNETKERISAFGELLKESPVKYFETKFERPVMLNEFVAAVVPKDIDAELKNSLIDNGIAIEEYERGNEESRLEAVKRASNREDVKFSIREDGSTIEGAEESKPVTLRSILSDRNIGLKEQITLSKALLAEQNKSDKTLRKDFVRSLTDNLSDVEKEIIAQKVYDKATVKRVVNLARIMLSTGHLSNLGKGEQQRLLSAIKNRVGANNNYKSVQKIMDIMVSNQLKNGELALEALERKKGTRVDSTRVQHVGELDPAGNIMLDAFKRCRRMSDEKLSEQIGDYLSKMDSNDEAIADNASNAYAGAMIARMYHEKIRTSIEDEQTLRNSLEDVTNDKELRKNSHKTYRQLVYSIKDAITQNRIDRAQAYYDLVGMLTNKMKDSAENAKQFKESEKKRVKNIHHIANSDMQGRKLRGDRKDNTLEGINNFPVFRFLASPLANLDQMLRMLGGKNSYGRGYLWNHFMRGWADSADKEQVATEKYYDMIDKKAAEIFGEKGYVFNGNPVKRAYRYTDLYSYAEDLPKATISYLDGGEMREYALSQAELLYLYAVEKMPLGRATNRKMGISEDVMEQITNVLDEKLKRFADWTQEELLPSLGNEMNAVHRRMFGANMDSIENYFPFVRDKKAIKVEVENGNLKNFNDKISVKTGAIKKRTANVIKWDMPNCNFFKVLAKHVDEGCHWMGFAEINKDFSTLLSYNRFKQQVMNINSVYGNGSTLWKTFANVCAIATDAYEPQRSESDELMVRIAKNVTLSKIAFNPMPAIKQLLSLPAFFGEIKPQYVMKSLLRVGVADVKWAWENIPNYRKRVKSRMIGDYYLRDSEFEKKGGIVGLLQTAGDKFESFAKKGMIANIGIDAWTIAVGAYGVYRTAKDKYIRWGMSEEKAEERAKQDATLCYNKSQQSSEGPFMSKVQIDHTFFSTMMMLFRNAATSYTRETHASLRNLKRLVSGEVDYEYMAKQILRQAEIPTFSKLFDSELNRQAEGTLANDHDYSLGTPGGKLQSAGIQDKPIKLFPELLSAVAEQNGLEVKYFSGLVDAINNPVAVFNEDGQTRIVVETDGGNDHCIIDIQPNEEGYRVTNIEPLSNHPNGYYMFAQGLLDFTAPRYINQGKAKRMLKMSGVLSEFNKEDAKAIRNIANNFVNPMVPEQQNFSVWRKEDIDKAKKQAKREIVGSTAKNIVNTAIFGLVLPWAWRIGGAASLLLISGDDDEKQEVIDDANRKAFTSGLEGIAYGDVVTDGLHVLWDRFVNGNKDAKLAYLGRNNPFYSDMSTMLRHMDRDVMQGCADIINIFISSMTGVNPQLVSNWTAAWMDKASGNRELSNEWGLFAARLVNTPKSQLENIYFEEVGLMGSECSNYTPEQLAMRFANYQVRRGYSIIPSSCVGDSAFTKQKNYAFKIIKEKMNNSIDKDTQQKYEQFSASINEGKKKVGEAKNKFIDGVIDGAQLYASLRYSKDYDIYRKYAKYDAELTKVVNLYLNCESTKEAKFLINSIRDIRRNLVESYDATLSGDTDKENASATKLDESVSKFWDDYYEMNPKALEKEQRKREVNKALSKQ